MSDQIRVETADRVGGALMSTVGRRFPGAFRERLADKPAVITATSGEALTYADLDAHANQAARMFAALAGGPGHHYLWLDPEIPGDASVNVNWYIYWGLRQHGFEDVAHDLARRTVAMQAIGGIREFYDPRSGEGQGATDFGWWCLVLDMIAAEKVAL